MDKLEQYLEQVCRGVGGSRAMRLHIREELREHLRDAAAEHRAAGLSEEAALARALEDFGGPEQVRSELEATHGHRFLAVVVDKAIEWKEKTMKARWLWMSWTHAALLGVIALLVFSITFAQIFLVPKFQQIMRETGYRPGQPEVAWMVSFLDGMTWLAHNLTWLVLIVAALWGLFEWRVRSENKTFMRLSGLGTVAVGLAVALALTTGSMLILMMLFLPGSLIAGSERLVGHLTASIDSGTRAMEEGLVKKDWQALEKQAERAVQGMDLLVRLAHRPSDPLQPPPEDRPTQVRAARNVLLEAQKAIAQKDAGGVEAALQRFRAAFQPVRAWADELGRK